MQVISSWRKFRTVAGTFTFRLALIYVGLFSLSVVTLFAFIYTFANTYLETQVRESIKAQYYLLLSEHNRGGTVGVQKRIQELMKSDNDKSEVYLLTDRDDVILGGNLNEWPTQATEEGKFEKEGTWLRFAVEDARSVEKGIGVRALAMPLSRTRMLLVGQTLSGIAKVEQTITQTFWASLLVTLLMALVGAIVITRSVMTRINTINRSAFAIMHGNLSARIPFRREGDEFDNLSSNLNQMLDKIEMLMQSIGQFANNIAHDLRSPLNRIISRLDSALGTLSESDPARPILEKNIRDMEELVGTFNSILKISELEAHADIRQFEPCELSGLLANVVDLYEPYASEKNIRIRWDFPHPLIVEGEKRLLTQAFANLLDNAIKFSSSGGEILVKGTTSPPEIIIADQGPGIPAAYRDKVFEKFFRLELSRHSKGNGLGLSMVAAIARIHGTIIKLEDNQPGLRVRLIFPHSLKM